MKYLICTDSFFSLHKIKTLIEQLCSALSRSWIELQAYYFQPNYYLTFFSPSDPAPPLFLWGAALPEAHPRTPPHLPISQQHHPPSSLYPSTKPLKLQMRSSARDSACDLTTAGVL